MPTTLELTVELNTGETVDLTIDLDKPFPSRSVVMVIANAGLADLDGEFHLAYNQFAKSEGVISVFPHGEIPYRSRAWKILYNTLSRTFGQENISSHPFGSASDHGSMRVQRKPFEDFDIGV